MLGSQEFHIAEQSASRLRIIAPGWSFVQSWVTLVMLAVIAPILFFALRSIRKMSALDKSPEQVAAIMSRERLLAVGLIAVSLSILWMLSYTRGEIDLDRGTNLVTMRSKVTVFLPEQVQTAPLNSVEEAWLDAKPNSRRIRLLRRHGPAITYPIWTDRPGQQQAVDAINSFVGKVEQ